MTKLIGAIAGFAIAAFLAFPAQADTASRTDGLRNAEQTEFSAKRRWKRHRHWRGRYYRGPRVYFGAPFYWGPRYYYWGPRYRYWPRYRYYRSYYPYYGYYRPGISVSFGFGPRFWW